MSDVFDILSKNSILYETGKPDAPGWWLSVDLQRNHRHFITYVSQARLDAWPKGVDALSYPDMFTQWYGPAIALEGPMLRERRERITKMFAEIKPEPTGPSDG